MPSTAELEKMVENAVKRIKPRRKPNRKPQPPKGKHNILTHYPKDPNCPICNQCKIQHQPCRVSKTKPDSEEKPKKFGDRLTADHSINPHGKTGRKGETVSLIIQDEATSWVQGYGCKTKSAEETKKCFEFFMGTAMKAKLVYTDNSQELNSALEMLGWPHDPSTPYKPQTNGIAERAVRRVKEGTSCMLLQSGFCEFWWPNAMQLYCLYRCVLDVLIGGETAYMKRYGVEFTGPIIPMGARVMYKPLDPRDKAKIEKYYSKVLEGIFIGHEQHYGGKCTTNLLIVNAEELEEASSASRVNIKRIPRGNVILPQGKKGETLPFLFTLAEGLRNQPGMTKAEKIRRRRYARIEKEDDQADDEDETEEETTESEAEPLPKEDIKLPGGKEPEQWEDESYDKSEISTTEGSDIPTSNTNSEEEETDSDKNDTESDKEGQVTQMTRKYQDSWIIKGGLLKKIHRQPRYRKFIPTEENCPIPLKYIDITRKTETTIKDKNEALSYDCWYDQPEVKLSEPWIGTTTFYLIPERPPQGYTRVPHVLGGELVKIQKTRRPGNIMKSEWSLIKKSIREQMTEEWKKEGPRQESLRSKRGRKVHRKRRCRRMGRNNSKSQGKVRRTSKTSTGNASRK